ncbi:MAG: DUF1819 family protein [Atopobiaceae bacterium]|jgi:hypothetical protein|nr:DUF1819 family protein [Atopobiaceae bacterium]MCI2172996.1 DUF1819 family protein [Atopobiaceae bacterium]MCI2208088.1 DUF1819 family protein [Atopobiaceae bacterium]
MSSYSLSYTAASLRRPESVTLAQTFTATPDWGEVRRRCVEDDILMLRFESSRKRISSELIKRLRNLSAGELEGLAGSDDSALQTAILWVAVCRTYEFVADFAEQVIAERWESGKRDIPVGAYETFFEEAALVHPEVAKLTESTRPRMRNQLYQMLREAGMLDDATGLLPLILPASALDLFGTRELADFPTRVQV